MSQIEQTKTTEQQLERGSLSKSNLFSRTYLTMQYDAQMDTANWMSLDDIIVSKITIPLYSRTPGITSAKTIILKNNCMME